MSLLIVAPVQNAMTSDSPSPQLTNNPAAEQANFLSLLQQLLGPDRQQRLYLCVRDLIANGLDTSRFPPGTALPSRQDITKYLAAWSREAGLTYEESKLWMMDFCPSKLRVLSKRTPAAIRHSTKGMLNYVYNSEVPFICDADKNQFRAKCATDCPVYAEMELKRAANAENPFRPALRPLEPIAPRLGVKAANREQFEQALELIRTERAKGTRVGQILHLLQNRGFKTRTGRKWSMFTLEGEIAKLKANG